MAMVRVRTFGLVSMAGALAGACAGAPGEQIPSLLTESPSSSQASESSYQLSPQELGYSCKKLTGVMQVRILQARNYNPSNDPSAAARGMQSVATPIFGGTTVGIDPAAQHRRDLTMLEAYNHQLAAKNCKTFDLAAELQKTAPDVTPAPQRPKKSP
jgi:hypothetical protein